MSTFVPVNPVKSDVAGVAVIVQVPEDGKPLNATLPVAKAQVGCVMVPMIGGVAPEFVEFTLKEVVLGHPFSEIFKLYVPAFKPVKFLFEVVTNPGTADVQL